MPSTIFWHGDAPAQAQVQTWTFAGTWLSTDHVTVQIGNKQFTLTVGSATIATLLTTLLDSLQAQTAAEFKEVAWANPSGSTITGTAATAGVPFSATFSTDSAAGTIDSASSSSGIATVASAGPADASTAANYSTGALPATGDTLIFAACGNPCLYNLAALSGVTLAALTIDMSQTGAIGLPYSNPAGYIEYRQRFLQASATTVTIGNGPGSGAGRINLDTGSVQTTVTVNGGASPADAGFKTINWRGTHGSNVVNLNKGSFAAAPFEGDPATVATWNQGYLTNQAGDVDALAGPGVTLTTINKTGGTLLLNSSFTTLNHGPGNAGECVLAAGAPGTLNVTGGNVRYRTSGNYTALNTTDSGYVDFAQGCGALTGTNTTCNPGSGSINDPAKRITFTNPLLLTGDLSDYPNLDLGSNLHLQRS